MTAALLLGLLLMANIPVILPALKIKVSIYNLVLYNHATYAACKASAASLSLFFCISAKNARSISTTLF